VVLCDACTVNDRKCYLYAHIRLRSIQVERAEYLTSIILSMGLLLWTATYGDKQMQILLLTACNEDHMTNSDETLFDGHQYEVCKYLPVLIW
jgi:hypothetical protein